MAKIAFIFPGQGAQKAGMGKDFYEQSKQARQVYDLASDLVGFSLPKLCFEKNDQLDTTEYTQVAMVTTSLAMLTLVEEEGIIPQVSAGLSLGEYCALVVAKTLQTTDAISVVRKRGIFMQNAVPSGLGAMSAVLGLATEKIEEVLSSLSFVQMANYNCPGQIVISGKKEAILEANEKLMAAGAKRTILLNVSGPFHSEMLKTSGEELAKELEKISFTALQIPYVSNVTASYIQDHTQIKDLLARQVYSPVRWQQSVEAMIAQGIDTFIEIGPGKTLNALIKKIDREVKLLNIETVEDLHKIKQTIT
ncbi:malonyl CoA-acyl carrier protein transacylase [Clostridia bacterium]|nr:malonyl CoA-acyl carrier protein transacylase [Clostridia bacterium]